MFCFVFGFSGGQEHTGSEALSGSIYDECFSLKGSLLPAQQNGGRETWQKASRSELGEMTERKKQRNHHLRWRGLWGGGGSTKGKGEFENDVWREKCAFREEI